MLQFALLPGADTQIRIAGFLYVFLTYYLVKNGIFRLCFAVHF